MNNKLKILIALLVFLVMPVLMAYVVASLFVHNKGTILAIIFFSLIALEIAAAIYKIIKYNKNK